MAEFLKRGEVELRPIEPDDINVILRWEGETEAWQSGNVSAPVSRHALWQYLKNYICDIYVTHEVRMLILYKGEPAGMVDVFAFDALNSRAEVGVYVDKEYRRCGIGTTAVRIAVENYAFGRLSLHQVYCTICLENSAAQALFRKAGFQGEAMLKQWLTAGNGTYHDAVVMQRLSDSCPLR